MFPVTHSAWTLIRKYFPKVMSLDAGVYFVKPGPRLDDIIVVFLLHIFQLSFLSLATNDVVSIAVAR
jgi:hypothetical protein